MDGFYGVYIAPILGVAVAFWLIAKVCGLIAKRVLPETDKDWIDRVEEGSTAIANGWASFWSGFLEGGFGEATYVYHFYDRQGRLLYVGITNDTRRRWEQHAADKPWWHLVARKERVLYSSREEAEKVEEHQIRTQRPMYNRAMNGWLR